MTEGMKDSKEQRNKTDGGGDGDRLICGIL